MVEDGAFSHKIDYFTIYNEILNIEGPQNQFDGASAVEGLLSTGPTPSSLMYLKQALLLVSTM